MTDAFRRCLIPVGGSLLDGLRVIERGVVGLALAVDRHGRLIGTLSDGDIRRALIKGHALESPLAPHMTIRFASVGHDAGRAEVLDLMQARLIEQIPVVDRKGRVVGLHLMHEMLGAVERPHWALVMAGGRGVRLRPLTDSTPKPMVRVAGRPILERIVLHLVGFGVRRVILAVNHLGDQIRRHFGDGRRFGCRIDYLLEKRPLGTGGPLSLLHPRPRHPLLVMNGDLVTQADFGRMLKAHERQKAALTVGVRPYEHRVPYGCVERRGDRITGLVEKPALVREVNAGIYVVSPSLLARVPKGREYPITSLIEDCLKRGKTVGAFEIDGDWIDVGQHEQLRQAREGKRGDDGV